MLEMRTCEPQSIGSDEFAELLTQFRDKHTDDFPIIIDTRPFLEYRQAHVETAVNVYVPPLLLRRLRKNPGTFNIEKLTNCQDIRQKLSRRMELPVVVYTDKQSTHVSPQIMPTVVETLVGDCKTLYVLEDSFDDMRTFYPMLIRHASNKFGLMGSKPSTINIKPKSRSPRHSRYIHGLEASKPSEIVPFLYLGNERDSSDLAMLRKLGVSKVINVSRDCMNHFPEFFEYLNIPVEDRVYTDISQHFSTALQFIERARSAECSVLVHCRAGVSRSATLIMAYLIQYQNKTLEEAFDFIKIKHPYVSPNFNFMGQLLQFQNQHRQKTSDGSTPASECWDDEVVPLPQAQVFDAPHEEDAHDTGDITLQLQALPSLVPLSLASPLPGSPIGASPLPSPISPRKLSASPQTLPTAAQQSICATPASKFSFFNEK